MSVHKTVRGRGGGETLDAQFLTGLVGWFYQPLKENIIQYFSIFPEKRKLVHS